MTDFEFDFIAGDAVDGTSVIYTVKNLNLIKGLYHEDGTIWFPGLVNSFDDYYEGLAFIDKDDGVYYADRKGMKLIFPDAISGTRFSQGRAFVNEVDCTHLVAKNGGHIRTFDDVLVTERFNEGYARIFKLSDGGNYRTEALIDREGRFVIPFFNKTEITVPDDVIGKDDLYSGGLMRIKIAGKYGYIDKDLQMVIPYEYEEAGRFNEGIAAVGSKGKYGFINPNNQYVLPCVFDGAGTVNNGLAPVCIEDRWGIIMMTGRFIIDCDFEEIRTPIDGEVPFKLGGKWGLMDITGRIIVENKYDNPFRFKDGIAEIRRNGRPGAINIYDEEILADNLFDYSNHRMN
jgi:hypothetical protein